MLCPYYGGGVRDTRRLEELLEELRERDALAAEQGRGDPDQEQNADD